MRFLPQGMSPWLLSEAGTLPQLLKPAWEA